MNLLKHAAAALLVISIGLSGCDEVKSFIDLTPDTSQKEASDISIRPAHIELNGVTGFVIMDNSNDTRTKSNPDDSNAQALYSIDKNGEIKITLFYFEVVEGDRSLSVTLYNFEIK